MKLKPDQERVKNLLSDTVALLCKNGLAFEKELKIQGLLGVTIDDNDVFIVHLNESYAGLLAAEEAETASVTSKDSVAPEQKSKDSRNEGGAPKRPHPSPMRSHSQSPHTESKRPRPSSSHLQSPHRRASHSSSNDSVVVQVKQEKEDDIELVEAKSEPNFGGYYGAHSEMGGPHGKRRTEMFPAGNAQEPYITSVMRNPGGGEPGSSWDPNSSQPSTLAHDSQLDATSGSSQWNPGLGLPPGSEGPPGEYTARGRRQKRFFCDEPGCEKGYHHNYELMRHQRTKHNIVTAPVARGGRGGRGGQRVIQEAPIQPQRQEAAPQQQQQRYVQQHQKEQQMGGPGGPQYGPGPPMGPGGPQYGAYPEDMPYDWFDEDDEEYEEGMMMEYDPEMDEEEEYYTSDDDLELISEEPSGNVGHLIVKTETGDIVHPGTLQGFGGQRGPPNEPTISRVIPLNRQQQQGQPRYRGEAPRQMESYSPQRGGRQSMGPPGPRMGSPQFRQSAPEQQGRMRNIQTGQMQQRQMLSPSRQYMDNPDMPPMKQQPQQRNVLPSPPIQRNVGSPMSKPTKQQQQPMSPSGEEPKPKRGRGRPTGPSKAASPKPKPPKGDKPPPKRQPRGKAAQQQQQQALATTDVTDSVESKTSEQTTVSQKGGKSENIEDERHQQQQQQAQVSTTHPATSQVPPASAPQNKVSMDDGVSSSSPSVVTAEAEENMGEPEKHLIQAIKEEECDD